MLGKHLPVLLFPLSTLRSTTGTSFMALVSLLVWTLWSYLVFEVITPRGSFICLLVDSCERFDYDATIGRRRLDIVYPKLGCYLRPFLVADLPGILFIFLGQR